MNRLAEFLHKNKEANPIDWLKVVGLFSGVLAGLEYAKTSGMIDHPLILNMLQILTVVRIAITGSRTTAFITPEPIKHETTTETIIVPSGQDAGPIMDQRPTDM